MARPKERRKALEEKEPVAHGTAEHHSRSAFRRREAARLPVLVVDDEPSLRAALSRELASEYDVVAAPGVEEALEILGERSDFVAVVSDLVMVSVRWSAPGFRLARVAREVQARRPEASHGEAGEEDSGQAAVDGREGAGGAEGMACERAAAGDVRTRAGAVCRASAVVAPAAG